MDETDPLPEIAGAFFNGDMPAAESVLMALEATETDPEMCAEFMMPDVVGAMLAGMKMPTECMLADAMLQEVMIDPFMLQDILASAGMGDPLPKIVNVFFSGDVEFSGA